MQVHNGRRAACIHQALDSTQLTRNEASECMQAQNEVAVLALLDHPNVVKYYECFAEQGTKVKIVMELCEVCEATLPHPAMSLRCSSALQASKKMFQFGECTQCASLVVLLRVPVLIVL